MGQGIITGTETVKAQMDHIPLFKQLSISKHTTTASHSSIFSCLVSLAFCEALRGNNKKVILVILKHEYSPF